MNIILSAFSIFAFHPLPAFGVAVVFALSAHWRRNFARGRIILSTIAMLWAAYGLWECYMKVWRSPTGDMAIRIDLVFIAPAMLLLTLSGLGVLITSSRTD